MGYYTAYNLHLEEGAEDPAIVDAIVEKLTELDVIGYALNKDLSCADAVKWYRYEKDMLEVSRAFPRVHFLLCGTGEQNEDMWEHHFWNGKSARYDAEIRIPPLNMADLK